MSYRDCAKKQTQCKGLKKGVKGYIGCVSEAGCEKAPRKSRAKPKAPPRPKTRPSKSRVKMAGTLVQMGQRIKEAEESGKLLTKYAKEGRLKTPKQIRSSVKPKTTRSLSKWQEHLREFRRLNPDIKGADVMKIAKDSYEPFY